MPSSSIDMKTPFFKLFNYNFDYQSLRIFGCSCFLYLRDQGKDKFSKKIYPYAFVGYSPIHKGYRYLCPLTNKVYISHHIVFNETIFPYVSHQEN